MSAFDLPDGYKCSTGVSCDGQNVILGLKHNPIGTPNHFRVFIFKDGKHHRIDPDLKQTDAMQEIKRQVERATFDPNEWIWIEPARPAGWARFA